MEVKLVNYGETGLSELGMNILYGNNKIGEIAYFPTAEKELRYLELHFDKKSKDVIDTIKTQLVKDFINVVNDEDGFIITKSNYEIHFYDEDLDRRVTVEEGICTFEIKSGELVFNIK